MLLYFHTSLFKAICSVTPRYKPFFCLLHSWSLLISPSLGFLNWKQLKHFIWGLFQNLKHCTEGCFWSSDYMPKPFQPDKRNTISYFLFSFFFSIFYVLKSSSCLEFNELNCVSICRGTVRFYPQGPSSCLIEVSILDKISSLVPKKFLWWSFLSNSLGCVCLYSKTQMVWIFWHKSWLSNWSPDLIHKSWFEYFIFYHKLLSASIPIIELGGKIYPTNLFYDFYTSTNGQWNRSTDSHLIFP